MDGKRSLEDAASKARGSRGSSPTRRLTTSAAPVANAMSLPTDPDDLVPSDDELGHATLTEGLKRLAVEPLDRRFHGKSSGVMLVQAAMNLKKEFSGADQPNDLLVPPTRRPEFWAPHPVSTFYVAGQWARKTSSAARRRCPFLGHFPRFSIPIFMSRLFTLMLTISYDLNF